MKEQTVSYTLLVFLLFICQPFIVINQTSQEWTGGREESGNGTTYRFEIIAKKGSHKLSIDKLWVGEDFFEIRPYLKPGFFNNNIFNRNDTIRVLATKFLGSDLTKNRNIHKNSDKYIVPPFDYKGDAIIGYMINKKRKYKKIESFTILKKLNYK